MFIRGIGELHYHHILDREFLNHATFWSLIVLIVGSPFQLNEGNHKIKLFVIAFI